MEKIILNNHISTIIKQNKNTPRIAFCMYMRFNEAEKKAGTYTLFNRLFMQGTKNRTSEELAQELEENAIELYSEMKQDYIKFRILCLNEDFEHAMELLEDIIFNSHFESFEKEVIKLKGEINAELDSPKTKAMDNYYKTIYKNHPYGNTYTKILESVDSIEKQDILDTYKNLIESSRKTIALVGDINTQEAKTLLEKHLSKLNNNEASNNSENLPVLNKSETVTIEKEDANQAQIIQGWIFPPITHSDYPVISLINTILGASGLSSRLFLELREKQGLAYTVRSSYESYSLIANFSVYIATEPKNIQTCLTGFEKEISKIKNEIISDEELEDAKNNLIGKRQFISETNHTQSNIIGLYESEGLGFDYEKKLLASIKSVTKEQIKEVANKYFTNNKVLSILAPRNYLSELNNH